MTNTATTTAARNVLTVRIPDLGTYQVTGAALDWTIGRYLPASINQLRDLVASRVGISPSELEGIRSLSTFLVLLADFDHNVDGDPTSIYA
jgi:hypothetical protein